MTLKQDIFRAAKSGSVERMKTLLRKPQAKHALNDRSSPESSPLHAAVSNSQSLQIVTALLDAGAEIDFTNQHDQTVLHLACEKGCDPLVEFLLKKGSSLSKVDKDGNNAVHIAVKSGNVSTLTCIVNTVDDMAVIGNVINSVNKHGKSPLLMVADCLVVDIMKVLIQHGAEASKTGEEGCTLLHMISKHPFTLCRDVMDYFINSVVSKMDNLDFINARNSEGETAAHIAVQQDRVENLQFLLKSKADVKVCDEKGFNILHQSAKLGKEEIVTWLLSENETGLKQIINNPIAADASYHSETLGKLTSAPAFTALHLALLEGHPHIVKCLLQHGANPEVADGSERTPLDLYEMSKRKLLAHKLWSVKACVDVVVDWLSNHSRKSVQTAARTGYEGHEKRYILEGMSDIEDSLEEFKRVIKDQIDQLRRECQQLIEDKSEETENLKTEQQQNAELEGMIRDIENQITARTQKIKEIVEHQMKEVVDDIDGTIDATNSFYQTQYNDTDVYNDYTYFRIFLKISQEVGFEKGLWLKLVDALMKNYPPSFKEAIITEIKQRYVSEKECTFEVLTRWKVYRSGIMEKQEQLKEALTEIQKEGLVAEIDKIFEEDINNEADDMKVNLTDQTLDTLARRIGSEWTNIGIQLGYEQAELDRFMMNNRNNMANSTKDMLIKWRDKEPGFMHFKFGILIEAFKNAGRNDLATSLSSFKF